MRAFCERTARVIGEAGVEKLAGACCAVFGVGGVGSYAAEALARAGVGRIIFIDGDTVDETNRRTGRPSAGRRRKSWRRGRSG